MMNQNVKKLIKQAGLNIDGFGDPIWGCLSDEDEMNDFLDKFVKLIIKECTNLILSNAGQINNMKSSDCFQSKIMRECANMISNHFGVK